VGNLEARLLEASKLGFKRFLVPAGSAVRREGRLAGVAVVECATLAEALCAALGIGAGGRRAAGAGKRASGKHAAGGDASGGDDWDE
jgi:hypothetical protein